MGDIFLNGSKWGPLPLTELLTCFADKGWKVSSESHKRLICESLLNGKIYL